MFANIRKAWYRHQDRKIAKQYEPKVKKDKSSSSGLSSAEKKPIIIMVSVISVFIITIALAFVVKNGKANNDKKQLKKETTTQIATTEVETTTVEITEEESLPEYDDSDNLVETKKSKKKKKKKDDDSYEDYYMDDNYSDDSYDYGDNYGGSYDDYGGGYAYSGGSSGSSGKSNNKKAKVYNYQKPAKKKVVKKPNNKVPSQSEHNSVLGGSNVSVIKNSLFNAISGSQNANMKNLARYLANNNSSKASSALKRLCGYNTLNAKAKKATVSIPSNDSDDIANATEKLIEKLSGSYGNYGIGISASFSGGKYRIIVVVAYQ